MDSKSTKFKGCCVSSTVQLQHLQYGTTVYSESIVKGDRTQQPNELTELNNRQEMEYATMGVE